MTLPADGQHAHSRVRAEANAPPHLATLQAAAALRGIVVQPLPGGGAYMVAQGVYSRECEDFEALAALMERMGVTD